MALELPALALGREALRLEAHAVRDARELLARDFERALAALAFDRAAAFGHERIGHAAAQAARELLQARERDRAALRKQELVQRCDRAASFGVPVVPW